MRVTTAQVDTRTVYQKKYPSTGIPCTAVRVFGLISTAVFRLVALHVPVTTAALLLESTSILNLV